MAKHSRARQWHTAQQVSGASGPGGGGRNGDTNSLDKVERKSLLPSSDHQQRLIFVGKTFLCHLSHEGIRETLRAELAQTVPISTRFSLTVFFFLIGFPKGKRKGMSYRSKLRDLEPFPGQSFPRADGAQLHFCIN